MFSVCIVIPVYNHEHAIGAVMQRVRVQGFPVVLVDDGSNPGCAAQLAQLSEQADVHLRRHARNRGKGAAVLTGLRAAHELGFTHAVQIDADGQHAVEDLPRFVDEARAHPHAVICGYPLFDGSIPKVRFYGRYLTHALVWLETLSREVIDSMCGFRLYPLASTLPLIEREHIGARMDFDTEMIVRLVWNETPTRWLPTRVSYPLDGVSHFRMLFDNVRMTSLHIRLVLGMLRRLPRLLRRRATRPLSD